MTAEIFAVLDTRGGTAGGSSGRGSRLSDRNLGDHFAQAGQRPDPWRQADWASRRLPETTRARTPSSRPRAGRGRAVQHAIFFVKRLAGSARIPLPREAETSLTRIRSVDRRPWWKARCGLLTSSASKSSAAITTRRQRERDELVRPGLEARCVRLALAGELVAPGPTGRRFEYRGWPSVL